MASEPEELKRLRVDVQDLQNDTDGHAIEIIKIWNDFRDLIRKVEELEVQAKQQAVRAEERDSDRPSQTQISMYPNKVRVQHKGSPWAAVAIVALVVIAVAVAFVAAVRR